MKWTVIAMDDAKRRWGLNLLLQRFELAVESADVDDGLGFRERLFYQSTIVA